MPKLSHSLRADRDVPRSARLRPMKLYNTLSGEATEFVPSDGNTVKMYVCGVTPYSATHIGHALSYVAFDVLRRYMEQG